MMKSNFYRVDEVYDQYLARMRDFGKEEASLFADPLFNDLEGEDFDFREGSPALKLGIESLDVSKMGLLKKIKRMKKAIRLKIILRNLRKVAYKRKSDSGFLSIMVMALVTLLLVSCSVRRSQPLQSETFRPLNGAEAPHSYEHLWNEFDPRKEPLETKILLEWEEDDVVMQVLRYRIGIFKGQKAMMAAIYGYPKGAKSLPGLVQIHGGGQYADYRAVLTNAKRGYATISISWAGRINAPDYKITPDEVKLFWAADTLNPDYKLTTDWGALDGYHAPCRNPENNFASVDPQSWTFDAVESARNNPWFLNALGARRALTFLEQQVQVKPDKLGVYGHSMGGKLTVLTASDPRVKAAAPSCGGISDNYNENLLYQKTLADNVNLQEITCPIIFLNPANDFHGHLRDLPKAVKLIKSKEWRVVSAAHHNHQDLGQSEVTGLLWFDQYLKGTFNYPDTPESSLELKTKSGIPSFSVKPDPSKPILEVDIYYTQQGENVGEITDRENRINRFWHHAKAVKKGDNWIANLPLISTDKPLWAYANVLYSLDKAVTGAGYYYGIYTVETFNLSTPIQIATAEQLKAAGVMNAMKSSLTIETFEADWEKEWFTYRPKEWALKTHKVYNDKWRAPENAKLALVVRSIKPNLLVIGIDDYATEIQLDGGSKWQKVLMPSGDFQNVSGETLSDWNGIMELRLGAMETLRVKRDDSVKPKELGGIWNGEKPEFKGLSWIIN
jgi:dienelactone hydrolase